MAVSPEPEAGVRKPWSAVSSLIRVTSESLGGLAVGVGRGEPDVGVAGPLDVVGDEPDVGVARQLAGRLHADDDRARARHRVGRHARGRRTGCRARSRPPDRLAGRLVEMSIVSAPRSGLATPSWNSERSRSSTFSPPGRRGLRGPRAAARRRCPARGGGPARRCRRPGTATMPPSRNARISRCCALVLSSSGLIPRTRAASSRRVETEPWTWSSRSRSAGAWPWLGRFKWLETAIPTCVSRTVSGSSGRRLGQRLDGRLDRGGLRRLIIIVLQLQVPLVLPGGLELDRALGIGGSTR